MVKILTGSQVSQFHKNGFLPAFPVLPVDQAVQLRANLESFEAENDGVLKGSLRFKNHLLFKWLSDLIRSPKILDTVEDIIGPDILVWSTDWWIKEANSPQFVSWHQDSQYWGLDTDKLVTVWIAISPSTIQSGCIRVLPGSHQDPDLTHEETYHDDNMLTRGQSIGDIDEDKAVDLVVDTGQAVLFAFRIAHASYPNQTDDRRIGLAIRYIPPDTQQQYSEQDSAALVRGVDNYHHFELEPEPRCDFDPVAVAFHKETEEIRRQILYHGTQWTTHRT